MNQKRGLALSFTGATPLLGLTQLLRLCTNQACPYLRDPRVQTCASPSSLQPPWPDRCTSPRPHRQTQAFRSNAGLPAFARLQLVSVFPGDPRPLQVQPCTSRAMQISSHVLTAAQWGPAPLQLQGPYPTDPVLPPRAQRALLPEARTSVRSQLPRLQPAPALQTTPAGTHHTAILSRRPPPSCRTPGCSP